MTSVVNDAAYTTAEVVSISKPETSDPDGRYAPACDTHRSPFAGRNFEYFSEDPVLGGKICSAVASAPKEPRDDAGAPDE
jgi:beta-glucosidase